MTAKLNHSEFKKHIIAEVIQNARIDMEGLPVFLAHLEWNQTLIERIALMLMSASTIFVIQTLHVRIFPVHITVNAMPDFLVMAIGAKILMSA